MKRFVTLLAFFMALHTIAQSKVSKSIDLLLAQNVRFEKFSLFAKSPTIENTDTQKAVHRATYAKLLMQPLDQMMQNRYDYIELEIPYLEETVTLQLYKVNLFAEGFHVDTDKAHNVQYNQGVHYRGRIKGDEQSVAAFNFFDGGCNGILSGSVLTNVVVGKLDRLDNQNDYIIYSDTDLKEQDHFECKAAQTKASTSTPQANPESILSDRCVTMYFELDYNLYQQNSSNVNTTTNWMASVFNNVQTIYSNEGITIALKSVFIWTTPDPYNGIGTDSTDYLDAFEALRPVYDGDVGQLLGIDPGSLGGVAMFVGGLCNVYGYSYADINLSFSTVPTYSWTVKVICHEFGHTLGSQHTHACAWNGNNTAIDGCGPLAGYDSNGNCPDGPIPSSTVKGTIMSYCHLLAGVGVNLANGFGPQPTAAILNRVNTSLCLSSDCINICANSVTNIQANVGISTATITWDDINPNMNHWWVSVTPYPIAPAIWVEVTTNSYTAEDLIPNTFYRIRVQPACSPVGTNFNMTTQVLQTGAQYCDGITMTNPTTFGLYFSNLNYIRTITPSLPNQKIRLNFSEFGFGADDYLYLYDGNSTAAPDLSNGGFTGSVNPGEFTSTAPDGSLTLRFLSNGSYSEGSLGYIAFADCISTLGTKTHEAPIDFAYYPNPTKGWVVIESKIPMTEVAVYNVTGQLLHRQSPHVLRTQIDVGAFATGTYFFTLKFNDRQANFKIFKM